MVRNNNMGLTSLDYRCRGDCFDEEVLGLEGPVLLEQPVAQAAQPFMAGLRSKSRQQPRVWELCGNLSAIFGDERTKHTGSGRHSTKVG
jgi:hypothetical protein